MATRPTWDDYFLQIAQVTRKRSPCDRLQVGCVLVREHRIISQGYNGFLPGCPHTSIVRDNHEQATVHAEQNAVADCAKRGVSCADSIAYITHYPCIICMRILCAAGIKKIVYQEDYKNDELVKMLSEVSSVSLQKVVNEAEDTKIDVIQADVKGHSNTLIDEMDCAKKVETVMRIEWPGKARHHMETINFWKQVDDKLSFYKTEYTTAEYETIKKQAYKGSNMVPAGAIDNKTSGDMDNPCDGSDV